MTRLAVIDDNDDFRMLVRLSLRNTPELELVGESGDASQAVAMVAETRPDVVLLDLMLGIVDGLALLPDLRKVAPQAAVIILSAYPISELSSLRHDGSIGILSKSTPPRQLAGEIAVLSSLLTGVEAAVQEAAARLAADPRSAGMARHFVDRTLKEWGLEPAVDVVTLLVSELVTNAVLHAGSELEVSVQLRGDRIRVDVVDNEPDSVKRRIADQDAQSGRGMDMVEMLAVAWGTDIRPGGKSVWFEVRRDDAA